MIIKKEAIVQLRELVIAGNSAISRAIYHTELALEAAHQLGIMEMVFSNMLERLRKDIQRPLHRAEVLLTGLLEESQEEDIPNQLEVCVTCGLPLEGPGPLCICDALD
jgi:hypothetical protein